MTEPPNKPSSFPPNNRTVAVFRIILWFLPPGFGVFSTWAGEELINQSYLRDVSFGSWVATNLILIVGAGWLNALLSTDARTETDGAFHRVARFFFIQLFLVSILVASLFLLMLIIDPIKC